MGRRASWGSDGEGAGDGRVGVSGGAAVRGARARGALRGGARPED